MYNLPTDIVEIGHQHYLLDEEAWNAFLHNKEHKIALLAFWADEDYATMLLLDYDVPFRLSVKIHLRRYSAPSQRYPHALWGEVMARDLWGVEAIHGTDEFEFDQGCWNVTWPLARGALKTEGRLIFRSQKDEKGRINIPFSQTAIAGLCDLRTTLIDDKISDIGLYLGAAHRGIIEQLRGKTKEQALIVIEKISGAGFFAHPLAFIRAWEMAEGLALDDRERDRRFIFLELERIMVHLYDLGQMAHYGEKAILASFCVFMREKMADILQKYGVSRRLNHLFSRSQDYDLFGLSTEILHFMKKYLPELNALYRFSSGHFRKKGVLKTEIAWHYTIGGVIGRASGRIVDMRRRDKGMRLDALKAVGEYQGCAEARGRQRLAEIRDSLSLIEMILEHFAIPNPPIEAKIWGEGLTIIEGARGDICYWLTLKEGRIEKIFIRDPALSLSPALQEVLEGESPENLAVILSSLGFSPAGAAL